MKAELRTVALVAGESHLARVVAEHLPDGTVRRHTLSQVSKDESGRISITPFAGERAATLYHDRPLHLFRSTSQLCEES